MTILCARLFLVGGGGGGGGGVCVCGGGGWGGGGFTENSDLIIYCILGPR